MQRIGVLGKSPEAEMHRQAWDAVNADLVALEGAGTGYYGELSRVLASRNAHGVSLCVPAPVRRALATDCLANGIHVFSELPLAGDVESALALVDAAERLQDEKGAMLAPATPLRFLPDVQFAHGIAGGGGLGDPKWFQLTLSPFMAPTGRETQHQSLSGGGLLFDLGSHGFDLIHHLFGRPMSVRASRMSVPAGLGTAQAIQVRCTFAGGMQGEIVLTTRGGFERLLTIEGADGVVEVGWTRSTSRLKGSGTTPFGSGNPLPVAYRQMAALFQQAAVGRGSLWTTMADCRQVLNVIRAAQRSLDGGRAIEPAALLRRPVAAA